MAPLFDVRLKLWENWSHYWKTVPWIARKMSGYDNIGKAKVVAGAFDPSSRTVHIFLDEVAQSAIAKLDRAGIYNKDNYGLELTKEMMGVLVHELFHSLPMFDSPVKNENHEPSPKKLDALVAKSMWYYELIRVCREMERMAFKINGNEGNE